MSTNHPLISIAHKIELMPNNKAQTHFRKAFGCARVTYNWGQRMLCEIRQALVLELEKNQDINVI